MDLAANAAKTVTVNGQTIAYGQVLAQLNAILAQERVAQLAAAATTPAPLK